MLGRPAGSQKNTETEFGNSTTRPWSRIEKGGSGSGAKMGKLSSSGRTSFTGFTSKTRLRRCRRRGPSAASNENSLSCSTKKIICNKNCPSIRWQLLKAGNSTTAWFRCQSARSHPCYRCMKNRADIARRKDDRNQEAPGACEQGNPKWKNWRRRQSCQRPR